MLIQEYKRYLKSKSNIIMILLALTMIIISYISTYTDIKKYIEGVNINSNEIDLEVFYEQVAGWDSFRYIIDYFCFDFLTMSLIVFIIGFSVIIAPVTFKNLNYGFGNYIVPKKGYGYYLKSIIGAQILYILTIITTFYVIVIIATIIVLPPQESYSATNLGHFGFLECITICFIQITLILIYLIGIMLITSLSTFWIKNKYLIMALPIMLYIVFDVIGFVLSNLFEPLGRLLRLLRPDNFIHFLGTYYQVAGETTMYFVKQLFTLPTVLLIIAIVFFYANKKKYTEAYL